MRRKRPRGMSEEAERNVCFMKSLNGIARNKGTLAAGPAWRRRCSAESS